MPFAAFKKKGYVIMKEFDFTIGDPLGLHARPAGMLVKEAQRFESEFTVTLARSGKSASLKRLLAVMGLGAKGGDRITVLVQGRDEEAAARAIERWLKEHLA
jgi:phosphocarrier protein